MDMVHGATLRGGRGAEAWIPSSVHVGPQPCDEMTFVHLIASLSRFACCHPNPSKPSIAHRACETVPAPQPQPTQPIKPALQPPIRLEVSVNTHSGIPSTTMRQVHSRPRVFAHVPRAAHSLTHDKHTRSLAPRQSARAGT